jgi:hypothetical protein
MSNNNPDDHPIPMQLKPVQLLQCTPGHAGEANTGKPITIVTLGHEGEVEQPMRFSIEDTQRLVVDCLCSLATHGDAFASDLVERYFQGTTPEVDPED